MAYSEQTWANGRDGGTKLNAARLQHMEDGIAAAATILPSTGSFTYNADGTIATDPDGNTYTWNADGTPNTQTRGGVTRTFHWNADGSLASVS